MLLASDSASFALTLTGYQFPDLRGDEWDSNWLLVRTETEVPEGAWTVTEPCLTTGEVEFLATWLDSLADGGVAEPKVWFTEPNLVFRQLGRGSDGVDLEIELGYESRPPGTEQETAQVVSLRIHPAALRDAAADLRAQLVRFPKRS